MRMLNQVLIEGYVSIEMPKIKGSDRLFIECENMEVEIYVPGENMQKYVKSQGKKDRGIRIVGKLITKNDRLMIIAEHIEFKLDYKKVAENV